MWQLLRTIQSITDIYSFIQSAHYSYTWVIYSILPFLLLGNGSVVMASKYCVRDNYRFFNLLPSNKKHKWFANGDIAHMCAHVFICLLTHVYKKKNFEQMVQVLFLFAIYSHGYIFLILFWYNNLFKRHQIRTVKSVIKNNLSKNLLRKAKEYVWSFHPEN